MEKYDEELLLAVLKAVEKDNNIDILINENISYADIGLMIKKLKRNGLISDLSGQLTITKIGTRQIKEMEKNLNYGNIEKLVTPQYNKIIERKDKYDVYLP